MGWTPSGRDEMAYFINVTIHVFAAIFWLGGMFFFAIVGAPVLRKVEDASLRRDLFRVLGERFRWVGWITLGILTATGTLNLWFRGMLNWGVLADAGFWASPYGSALAWKLAAVGVMLMVQAAHDFLVGPASSDADPGSPEAARLRRVASWLARTSAAAGVAVVIAAVRLARLG